MPYVTKQTDGTEREHDLEEIIAGVKAGSLSHDSPVRRVGDESWMKIGTLLKILEDSRSAAALEDWQLRNALEEQMRRESARRFWIIASGLTIFIGPALLFPEWPYPLGMGVIAAGIMLIYAAGVWVRRGFHYITARLEARQAACYRAHLGPPETRKENEYRVNAITAEGELQVDWDTPGLTLWLHHIGAVSKPGPWQAQVTDKEGGILWGGHFADRDAALMAIRKATVNLSHKLPACTCGNCKWCRERQYFEE